MEDVHGGSPDSLTAMPGDKVLFESPTGEETKTVENSGWQPAAKSGKVWSYLMTDGTIVPHTSVIKIVRALIKHQTLSQEITSEQGIPKEE